jgi:enamine deaminase RidA (YjgF/YER057c/UK114 family)
MADELVEKFGLDSTDDIDVNVVQTDTIDFGLSFAATQCRHNMTNANPFGGASTPE